MAFHTFVLKSHRRRTRPHLLSRSERQRECAAQPAHATLAEATSCDSLWQFDSVSIENTDSTDAAASVSPKTLRFALRLPYLVSSPFAALCLESKINWVEKLTSVPGEMEFSFLY